MLDHDFHGFVGRERQLAGVAGRTMPGPIIDDRFAVNGDADAVVA